MAIDEQRKQKIYEKTDGHCHICRKKLARKNYGVLSRRGAWEIEHSNAKANGGSNHLNNLYPACISCNRSKGAKSTASARKKNGYKAAPLPRNKKVENAWVGGVSGAIAVRLLLAPLGPIGIVAGAVVGALAGASYEPE